ncbi:DUF262 domain-containing protein [Flavobacterium sp.]|uniref:DUF262 domain-containing protein n=1 Tax=Flavobacterium sp. TaxID=239 RepID=UPI0008B11BB4|nr:DUF262 domain-containing protein [Flavobacterium sp.]OGS60393.1 MAG: hypothetical protein A2X07_05595 [Flavobacteria bacterium GWF1_32_7]HBD25441.1 hypothetical protein [Flavobacterium sp.]
MKATETVFKNFLTQNKTQFVIPVYQRNYDWTSAECKQLLYDIIEVGGKKDQDDTHFIGSIVFIHDGVYTSSDVKQLVIIDGQQRLTTMTLLYLALYRFALANDLEEKAAEINETILINRFVKEENSKLKLKQTDVNAKAFRFLMNENNPGDYNEYSRVIENYNFFYHAINLDNFSIITEGLNRLLFVEISLERGKDDPQRIFESLNSTGLELSQADLIRNYILMGLEPKEQVRIFENYWEIIENNAKIENSHESKVSELIRDYLTLINKKIPNKSKVYEEFKVRFKNRDESFYSTTLQTIKQYSIIYNKFLNPQNEQDREIRNELRSIKQMEINVSYPFLMPVYHDYSNQKIDKTILISVLRLVQSYVWRRFILGLPTNALNKIFMTLYGDVNTLDYLASVEKSLLKKKGVQRYPNNSDILVALKDKDMYNTQAKNRLYYFEQMEHFRNPERVDLSSTEITIEHIFPQNPDIKWQSDISEVDYIQFKEKYLNTVANLTLSGNNGALGNKSFSDKREMNKDEGRQGYRFSNLWLNEQLKTIDVWDIEAFDKRFELLYNRFVEIWRFPAVEIEQNTEEEFTLFDAPEPRNKRLEYYTYKDEQIVTNEFSKMYYHVIQDLFNESPSKFLLSDLKDIIQITTDKDKLRSFYPITDTYYLETNIDSNTKFSRLKKVLTAFELEDELIIKYE